MARSLIILWGTNVEKETKALVDVFADVNSSIIKRKDSLWKGEGTINRTLGLDLRVPVINWYARFYWHHFEYPDNETRLLVALKGPFLMRWYMKKLLQDFAKALNMEIRYD